MQKIPTVLRRDPDDMRRVLLEVTPGCEWVLAGEGVARRKFDGTCVMLDDAGAWWARREVKPGKRAPEGFVAIERDDVTGKVVGWEPIAQSPFARWHAEALRLCPVVLTAGTYELCGPKVNGNPEDFDVHLLVRHDDAMTLLSILDLDTPAEIVSFARWAGEEGYEGIVWHHPDGRMAKIKARDVREDPTRRPA